MELSEVENLEAGLLAQAEQDEPATASLLDSLLALGAHWLFFYKFTPWLVTSFLEWLWPRIFFGANLSNWISWAAGISVGILLYAALIITRRTVKYVKQGFVQFIRSDIPGLDHVVILEGGLHFLIPIYSNWNEPWEIDQRWEVNTTCTRKGKDGKDETHGFRVSANGFDVEVEAVTTVRPNRLRLLPLHLLSNDRTQRRELAVKNLEAALKREIEECITNVRIIVKKGEKVNGVQVIEDEVLGILERWDERDKTFRLLKKTGTFQFIEGVHEERGFKSLEEVVGQSELLGIIIYVGFGMTSIIRDFGLNIDTFSLGTIDDPAEVAKRRDIANGAKFMIGQAQRSLVTSKDPSSSEEGYLNLQLVMNGDVKRTSDANTSGLDKGTLLLIKEVAAMFANGMFAKGNAATKATVDVESEKTEVETKPDPDKSMDLSKLPPLPVSNNS